MRVLDLLPRRAESVIPSPVFPTQKNDRLPQAVFFDVLTKLSKLVRFHQGERFSRRVNRQYVPPTRLLCNHNSLLGNRRPRLIAEHARTPVLADFDASRFASSCAGGLDRRAYI